ncbi:MAG TPA: tetratricopeptide repeat protein [Bdellovibrionota bacterium]|nr:tetratricopeptide repeat protein [Bdellovibrionota bacterium]
MNYRFLVVIGASLFMFGCLGSTSPPPSTPAAEEKIKEGKVDEAASQVPAAEFATPSQVSARSAGDFRQTVDRSLRSIEQNPRNFDAYMDLGKAYRQLNQNKEAERAFENASLVKPNAVEPMLELAETHSLLGHHLKAVAVYQDLLKHEPKNAGLKNSLSIAYRKNKDFRSAEDLVREILNTDKTNIYAINNLGLIYYDSKRYQLAELTFQKGKKINPKTAETYNNLGLTYLAMDMPRNAINEFRRATELNPSLVSARMNLANIYLKAGNYPKAIQLYEEVLRTDPLNIPANQNLGVAYLTTGEVAKARQAFSTNAGTDPNNGAALFNLGLLYQNNLQDPETALKYFQRFVAVERLNLAKDHEVFGYIKQLQSMPKRPKVVPTPQPTPAAAVQKAPERKAQP